MKTTVNFSDFVRAFVDAGRADNFTHEGLRSLFDYFEEYEESTGEEIELDVIAICCDYSEDALADIARMYSIDLSDCEDEDEQADTVRDYLNDNTKLVGEISTGFVYANF